MWKKIQLLKIVEFTKPEAQIRPRGDHQFHSALPASRSSEIVRNLELFL